MLHSPKLQYYWSLTIRLFSVISRTLIGGVLPLCRDAIRVFCSPSRLDQHWRGSTPVWNWSRSYCSYLDIPLCIYKLATHVEGGDLNAPFSIATTLRCRWGLYSFPRLFHFTLDTYLIMLSVKQGGIKYHF